MKANPLCRHSGCPRPRKSGGMCLKHYKHDHYLKVEYPRKCSPEGRKGIASTSSRYQRTLKGRYCVGRSGAKGRGLTWGLTPEQYELLIKPNKCHYCSGNLSETGSGLDRIDPSKGYDLDNVLPCCLACNLIRGTQLSVQEMEIVSVILRYLRGNDYA